MTKSGTAPPPCSPPWRWPPAGGARARPRINYATDGVGVLAYRGTLVSVGVNARAGPGDSTRSLCTRNNALRGVYLGGAIVSEYARIRPMIGDRLERIANGELQVQIDRSSPSRMPLRRNGQPPRAGVCPRRLGRAKNSVAMMTVRGSGYQFPLSAPASGHEARPQLAFEDLPVRVARQRRDEGDGGRALVVRQPVPGECD